MYDELTINERQKKDQQFSSLLHCVRLGSPTDETFSILEERLIKVSTSVKFSELQKSGQAPVCLFPTRKACHDFNTEMLSHLTSRVHELVCTDEMDLTASTRKWNKKMAEQLEKLNSDCTMTAGLEAKLFLAVGARVMLRRNIDTKAGLVNGAIGIVLSISLHHVTVKFDHINKPYDVEMVKSRFMVMKKFYVYRKQFPLVLAYAVTIHKCQGLSLDCAIVDLSDAVFSPGMAYVALSRVRTLSGLFLSAFNPKSLMVSPTCLREMNRLRKMFRKDLPSYDIPQASTSNTKHKLTSTIHCDSLTQKQHDNLTNTQMKRKRPCTFNDTWQPAKRIHCSNDRQNHVSPLKFYPVDEHWQQNVCLMIGLYFHDKNRVRPGGPNVPLTPPDMRTVKRIKGDGNCLFRALSYIISGSEEQHMVLRRAIIQHMIHIAHFIIGHHVVNYTSIQEYITDTNMDQECAWGTDIEILTLSHLLHTPIMSYSVQHHSWQRYAPHNVDRSLTDNILQMSLYLVHKTNHFDVACSVRKSI